MVVAVGGGMDAAASGRGSYSAAGDKIYTLKFVMAGSPGVGKTQLASLFHKKHDGGNYPSVGMQFATRTLRYGEHSCVRAQVRFGHACVGFGYIYCVCGSRHRRVGEQPRQQQQQHPPCEPLVRCCRPFCTCAVYIYFMYICVQHLSLSLPNRGASYMGRN